MGVNAQLRMTFGKYKGELMDDVPAEYLMWAYEGKVAKGEVLAYIQKNLAGIKKQIADNKRADGDLWDFDTDVFYDK